MVYDEEGGSLKDWVHGKDLSEEEKAARIEALTNKMKAEGKLMLPGPISQEEAKAMMAKLKESNRDG